MQTFQCFFLTKDQPSFYRKRITEFDTSELGLPASKQALQIKRELPFSVSHFKIQLSNGCDYVRLLPLE